MKLANKNFALIFLAEPEVLGLKKVNNKILNTWLTNFFEMSLLAEVTGECVFSGNGLDTNFTHWHQAAEFIHNNKNKYDGFIVLHSADNLVYASSYLSFVLAGLSKPVVLTSSIIEQTNSINSDFFNDFISYTTQNNILNTIQAASLLDQGVMVLSGTNLLKSNRIQKTNSKSLNLFENLDNNPAGTLLVNEQTVVRNNQSKIIKYNFNKNLNNKVGVIELFPNQHYNREYIMNQDALVVRGGEVNKFPTELQNILENYKGFIVYLGTRTSKLKKINNIVFIENIVFESLVAKAVWAISQTVSFVVFKKLLKTKRLNEFIN